MSRRGPVFQDHHAIEQQTLERSPLLKAIAEAGHFNIHAPENRIFLPADPAFAQTLGITPHSGGPIADYQNGLIDRLLRLEQSPDGAKALAGDPDALARIAGRVETFRDTLRSGLINGDLYTNAPYGLRADDIRPKVQGFFQNESSYGQAHAAQLQQLKGFAPVDNGWAAITHTEGRVVSALQHVQTIPNPLTRGGATELQRHGLSLAISNAHHDGRGFVPAAVVAVVAADALLLSKAFERGADLLDNRAIYHQTVKAGVEWQFNGRNWERQAAMDRTPDGLSNPVQHSVVASYETPTNWTPSVKQTGQQRQMNWKPPSNELDSRTILDTTARLDGLSVRERCERCSVIVASC